ncbi:choline/carnitine/betaine transport [Anaerovirgula multivorans]|uniref:Choline/carnitine/betaine transport n=1 Tax=Anaerovirgula multivorans TaxID=312168 RepID=A0A239I9A1_9FIRM|nr:BCCT family transporter [Anaerovirgula multivorans]SNS89633.1 choline/carnitine/betaine transport [Anaerovirgula multivorans]
MKASNEKAKLRMAIFVPMSIIFLTAIIVGLVAPAIFLEGMNKIVEFAFVNFGWLFQISGNIFLAMCLYLMFSKYGDIKLGGPDAKPELSNWNWFAISLCAGIATGILFWGIAEPITHFMSPPLGLEAMSEAAAMFSMTTTFIHWTYIPYAMYGIAGIGVAFAVYNMKLPYQVSSTLYPLFGKKIAGSVGDIVDNVCLFAMAGAVAAVLGVGTMQIGSGLNVLTGITTGKGLWITILLAIVVTYVISSYTGLDRGIRWLSDKNSKLFLAMMVFIFIVGPTQFILSLGTQSVGDFLQNFFVRTHYLSPIEGSAWPRWWPIYYWAIWLAYAPLIGMFLARLSRGRTIRQFMLVNVMVPATFGLLWFSVFGGSAIHLQLNGAEIWESIQQSGLEVSVFAFLDNFPLSGLLSAIFIVAIFVSIVTMADSMTSTVASLSTTASLSKGAEPPTKVKLFWGGVMSSMAIINILSAGGEISGIDATKQIATVAGFPILFFMLLLGGTTMYMIMKQSKYDLANCPETAEIDESVIVKEEATNE